MNAENETPHLLFQDQKQDQQKDDLGLQALLTAK